MTAKTLHVLIVESDNDLGRVWTRHLERHGLSVHLVQDQEAALGAMRDKRFDVLVVDLLLRGSSAFSVADMAVSLQPEVPIVFVTNTSFFSDGSVFGLCANARAFVNSDTPPEDLSLLVEHYARAG